MSNHCLVCGNQNTGKKYLINKLIKNVQFNPINNNRHDCIWKIMNKYYESDVTFTIINSLDLITPNQPDFDEDMQPENKESQSNPTKLDLSQFSAIILVLNLNQSHSLIEKNMHLWINALSPYASSSECSLFIGNYINPYSYSSNPINQTKQKEYHQFLHNFCIDNYFEFVPSPNDNDNGFFGHNSPLFSSYDAMELSHNRINSALQCVMWPNMNRNANTGKKVSNSGADQMNKIQPLLSAANTQEKYVKDSEEKVNEKKEDFNEKNQFKKGDKVLLCDLKSKQNWNGKMAEIVGPFSRSKKRWPIQLELIENDNVCIKKALIKSINLVSYKEKVVNNTKTKTNANAMMAVDEEKVAENKEIENKEFVQNLLWNANNDLNKSDIESNELNKNESESLEGKMSSFQSLINEMHQVRHAAKSGQLSDDERRQRAADTAMKLMSYMGLENQDNEKESEEENIQNN